MAGWDGATRPPQIMFRKPSLTWCFYGADDRPRTGDLNLGKVALYQLSYIRREPKCTNDSE
jgi:hypothetical protein